MTGVSIVARCLNKFSHKDIICCVVRNQNAVFYKIPPTPKQRKQGRPDDMETACCSPRLRFEDKVVDNNTLSVANKVVRTKMCPADVRLVVIRTRPKKSKPYRYFCVFTSDLERTVDEVIRHYRNRWQIETTFRDVKQNFGFDTYQLRNRKSLKPVCSTQFCRSLSHTTHFHKHTDQHSIGNKYR